MEFSFQGFKGCMGCKVQLFGVWGHRDPRIQGARWGTTD